LQFGPEWPDEVKDFIPSVKDFIPPIDFKSGLGIEFKVINDRSTVCVDAGSFKQCIAICDDHGDCDEESFCEPALKICLPKRENSELFGCFFLSEDSDRMCKSGICLNFACQPCRYVNRNDACEENEHCAIDGAIDGINHKCISDKGNGALCRFDDECKSGKCLLFVCAASTTCVDKKVKGTKIEYTIGTVDKGVTTFPPKDLKGKDTLRENNKCKQLAKESTKTIVNACSNGFLVLDGVTALVKGGIADYCKLTCDNCVDPSVSSPCALGGGVEIEGELHAGKAGADTDCLVPSLRNNVYSEAKCKDEEAKGNSRHIWYSCKDGQFVNKGSNQCLQYSDNFFFDEIQVKDCDWDSNKQKFLKEDAKERRVNSIFVHGEASTRTEFRLRAKSGIDHCLSARDCSFKCYVAAGDCDKDPQNWFFLKKISKSRFDYWSEKDEKDFTFPSLYDEAHDGIVASAIMYGLTATRYNLRKGTPEHSFDRKLMEKYFFKDYKRPADNNVTLQEIFDVVVTDDNDWFKKELKSWLKIWSEKRRKETSLHFFSDTLPTYSPLSFGIFVEEASKRISVWITGSQSLFSERNKYFKDWKEKNAKCDLVNAANYSLNNQESGVQAGFSSVVDSNFENIANELKRFFSMGTYDDYKVYVFGHSMGGSTSTLLGYRLALELYKNEIVGIPKPISIVSLAAPKVGDAAFQKTFNILEREGFLRHLRMRNNFDPAPLSTGFDIHFDLSTGPDIHFEDPGKLLGDFSKCTVKQSLTAKDVGINVHLRDPNSYITYAPENAEVDYQDVRDRALTRTLLDYSLPEPYDFIGISHGHDTTTYMRLLFLDLKDKEFNLNNLYENWLA